jgi:RHH-type transcriptional regulator, proline utilization regulon repressor / proline dehydrogenase / delta 1-pyrroline-5-carboxylate dehydrogenase
MDKAWSVITMASLAPEAPLLRQLLDQADLDGAARQAISAQGADLVARIRSSAKPGLMEVFLAEYGLSTQEGIALMCLAEALLRVPDAATMDALIEDKIAPSDWGRHLGQSASSLVNASTWALMLTGKVLDDAPPGLAGHLRGALKRLGEPVIRAAVGRAMREMGGQFVLGETIQKAMKRARELEGQGYSYSYDMLGEAARTEEDARRYHLAYGQAITAIAGAAKGGDIKANPGISVKLSALHPRYEWAKRDRVMAELVPRLRALAGLARSAGIGLNVDAEEADRLVLSLEVIKAALEDPGLAGWDGFGVVVQAYGRRAGAVIDWLHGLAGDLDRRIMVRLVKGAYWDAEVKRAQVLGLADFPVFTRKESTDVSYIALARKLLGMTDRIYPQFATHNAHTVAAVLHMGRDLPREAFEFQRLHGMGERLHDLVLGDTGRRCRIYAPVGAHRDLLAYLVRRLLENGANSSFVNQIVDEEVSPLQVAACPMTKVEALAQVENAGLARGPELFGARRNSAGLDLTDLGDLARVAGRDAWRGPLETVADGDVEQALAGVAVWDAPAEERATILRRASDLYEANLGPILAVLAQEAGKTLPDAVGELREAVDFLRYYADGAGGRARGVFACISPWNFPLAIFTGQIAAALAMGNGVIAKPAPQTPLIAKLAVDLLHQAGVPAHALRFVPGGPEVGAALVGDARLDGVVFTGSTATARRIQGSMAATGNPSAPLIAETGGLNAMIVDSTALPEQAVRDVLASAFQSAGQRCSALRCLYVQEDVAQSIEHMLIGAMQELRLGDPWDLFTDIGPVIDAAAKAKIDAHIEKARAEGRLLFQLAAPEGLFVGPAVIRVDGIADLGEEIFGPVLHIAPYKAGDLAKVIAAINATGYGLTMGLHSRIDDRVQQVVDSAHVGNLYVNRNQIGAVVGSQPFGGEGFSGTGPKAGGPLYAARFCQGGATLPPGTYDLPGPTGESNRLTLSPRLPVLCLGPGDATAQQQAEAIRALGGVAETAPDLDPKALVTRQGISGVMLWADRETARPYAQALAQRPGPILPLISDMPDAAHALIERHVCIDTTAAGGNAQLLAQVSKD